MIRRPLTISRARASVFLVVAALYLPGGCDLFQTRDPVLGDGERSLWEPPTSPEIIIRNLETAFENGIFNDYRRALTQDFLFLPDPVDVVDLQTERPGEEPFADWNREVEASTAELVFGGQDSVAVEFELVSEEVETDGRLLKEDYVLTLNPGADETVYEGQAWFRVRELAGGEWFIHEWQDVRTGRDSWGLLKGRTRIL